MKKIVFSIVFVLFLMLFKTVLADTIYRKNGRKTICIITEVYAEVITFRLPSDIHGTERKMKKSDIAVIFYDNGTYDVLPEENIGDTRNYRKPVIDIIITKGGKLLEVNVIKVDTNKIQFNISKNDDDTVYTRTLKTTVAVIYSTGRHQIFNFGRKETKILKQQREKFLSLLLKESDIAANTEDEKGSTEETEVKTTQETDSKTTEETDVKTIEETVAKISEETVAKISEETVAKSGAMGTLQENNEINDVTALLDNEKPANDKYLNENNEGGGKAVEKAVEKDTVDVDFGLFEAKSQEKINDFTAYLGVIASRYTDAADANNAIELSVNLFVNEDAVVQVSSVMRPEVRSFPIRTYLERLKLLKYDHVEMDWVDINYVSDFRKGQDGNYYGTVSLKQTFKGYIENILVYHDTTEKDIEVVVKGIEKNANGEVEYTWDVLLSDVGVRNTNADSTGKSDK